MITTGWACEADKNDLIDFIDYVFSKNARPHDFATLLPKLYGANGDAAPHHFAVREDGRIIATLIAYPVRMRVNGMELLHIGIGSVSVHPRARGRGYMQLMLDAADAKARELGADFAVLSGQRQRYEHYGYAYTGMHMDAVLTRKNVRHTLSEESIEGISLRPMEQADVPQALAIHHAQRSFCLRPEAQFIDILSTWNNQPQVILKDGEMIGYATLTVHEQRANIAELQAREEALVPAMLKKLSSVYGDLSLTAAPWETQRAQLLSRICEDFSLVPDNLYKIYNSERVRQAFGPLGGGEAFSFCGFQTPMSVSVASVDCV